MSQKKIRYRKSHRKHHSSCGPSMFDDLTIIIHVLALLQEDLCPKCFVTFLDIDKEYRENIKTIDIKSADGPRQFVASTVQLLRELLPELCPECLEAYEEIEREGWKRLPIAEKEERVIKLSPEAKEAMEHQMEAFKKKFGREPEPHDPIFFDSDAETPQPIDAEKITEQITQVMESAGLPPEKIYAFRKSGVMLTEENWHFVDPDAKKEWFDAIEEYEASHKK